MAEKITFVKELPQSERRGRYNNLREVLKSRPGEWAQTEIRQANNVTSMRRGDAWQGYEFATRAGITYARYVGETKR